MRKCFTPKISICYFLPENPEAMLKSLKNELRVSLPVLPPGRMELLLLYHPDDESSLVELENHLASLRHSGLVEVWNETKIKGGDVTEDQIQMRLASSQIIIPLLSASFLADDRLYLKYLDTALQRHALGTTKVMPLLLSPCDVINTPLFELNTLYPKPKGRALNQKTQSG